MGARPEAHYTVSIEAGRTDVARRLYPATDPATNLPPTVAWLEPGNGSVFPVATVLRLAAVPETPTAASSASNSAGSKRSSAR
ncbi:MAG: hypothetical protein M5U12_14005 [Verrucomicrobia bacterium]|nr:hypothetical protein [Verrucomicrobiota bacterium]